MATEALFLLQDSRQYVGNDMLFWQQGGGYTSDFDKAQRFCLDDAMAQHHARPSDIPWPVGYLEARLRRVVDMQEVRRADLAEQGITLVRPRKVKPTPLKCAGCQKFMSKAQFWSGVCPHCGTDSRP